MILCSNCSALNPGIEAAITALRLRAETAERERDDLKTDVVRFKMHLESAERAAKANAKEATEAYAKGQRDFQGRAAQALEDYHSGILDLVVELVLALPIKNRP
jgi:hypothetical protein